VDVATSKMPTHHLGSLEAPAIGLGCMGLSELRGPADEDESIATIQRAVDLGANLFDTANIYGFENGNERLLAKALKGRRDDVIIATKFGIVREIPDVERLPGTVEAGWILNGRPEYARACCEQSLRYLETDVIDLYFVHRVDPDVPIEETIGGLSELVAEGKVRHIGLSEVSPRTIRRAHAVHPLAAVESEYSLWTRDIEDEVLPTCRELGIGIIPYSPLGRGFLSGTFLSREQFAKEDLRIHYPWFSPENFTKNVELAQKLAALAQPRGCTAAQLALTWLRAQGDDIVPIVGSKRRVTLEENVASIDVELSAEDIAVIEQIVPKGAVAGTRYADMNSVAGETR